MSSLRVIVLEAEGEGVSALLEQLPALLGVRSAPSPTLSPTPAEPVGSIGGSMAFWGETPVCVPVSPATPFVGVGDSLEADMIPAQVKRVVDDCSYHEDVFAPVEPEEEAPAPAKALGELILQVNEEAHAVSEPKSKPVKATESLTPGKFSGRILSAFRIGTHTPDARLSRSVKTGIDAVVAYWGFEPPKCEDWTNRDGLVWINSARAEKGLPPHSIPIPPMKTAPSPDPKEPREKNMNHRKRAALEAQVKQLAMTGFKNGSRYYEVLVPIKEAQLALGDDGLDGRSVELLVTYVQEEYLNSL